MNCENYICLLVVTALISNGDEETAEGRLRSNALNALCDMNPGQALCVRSSCVEMGKMPSLMLKLSLKDPNDLVSQCLACFVQIEADLFKLKRVLICLQHFYLNLDCLCVRFTVGK